MFDILLLKHGISPIKSTLQRILSLHVKQGKVYFRVYRKHEHERREVDEERSVSRQKYPAGSPALESNQAAGGRRCVVGFAAPHKTVTAALNGDGARLCGIFYYSLKVCLLC